MLFGCASKPRNCARKGLRVEGENNGGEDSINQKCVGQGSATKTRTRISVEAAARDFRRVDFICDDNAFGPLCISAKNDYVPLAGRRDAWILASL